MTGQARNTVFVFSSDNGYHLGEYRLPSGKQTAFDTDILVPLIVAGPGIAPGSVNPAITENVDLRPTFDAARRRARTRPASTGTASSRCCTARASRGARWR